MAIAQSQTIAQSWLPWLDYLSRDGPTPGPCPGPILFRFVRQGDFFSGPDKGGNGIGPPHVVISSLCPTFVRSTYHQIGVNDVIRDFRQVRFPTMYVRHRQTIKDRTSCVPENINLPHESRVKVLIQQGCGCFSFLRSNRYVDDTNQKPSIFLFGSFNKNPNKSRKSNKKLRKKHQKIN